MNKLVRFFADTSAATSIEYAAIASCIAVAIVTVVASLGSTVKSNYSAVVALFK
jgi:pilus assembly protein Flp/PilA